MYLLGFWPMTAYDIEIQEALQDLTRVGAATQAQPHYFPTSPWCSMILGGIDFGCNQKFVIQSLQ